MAVESARKRNHLSEVLFFAETAYKAMRYDDMYAFTKQFLQLHKRMNDDLEPPMQAFSFDLNLREKALFTKCYKLHFESRFKGWEKIKFKVDQIKESPANSTKRTWNYLWHVINNYLQFKYEDTNELQLQDVLTGSKASGNTATMPLVS